MNLDSLRNEMTMQSYATPPSVRRLFECSILLLVVACLTPLPVAIGQIASATGISVVGTGEVAMKPDWMAIRVRVNATAEELADVKTQFQDHKRRFTEAMTALVWDNLKVEGPGPNLSLSSMQGYDPWGNVMVESMEGETSESSYVMSEIIEVRVSDLGSSTQEELLDRVSKLLAAVKGSGHTLYGVSREQMNMWGYQMGTEFDLRVKPPLEFGVKDIDRVEREANVLAIQNAKAQAEQLAAATGETLGRVLALEVTPGRKTWESTSADAVYVSRVRIVFGI
jgi:uncharacterized protein YggE